MPPEWSGSKFMFQILQCVGSVQNPEQGTKNKTFTICLVPDGMNHLLELAKRNKQSDKQTSK